MCLRLRLKDSPLSRTQRQPYTVDTMVVKLTSSAGLQGAGKIPKRGLLPSSALGRVESARQAMDRCSERGMQVHVGF